MKKFIMKSIALLLVAMFVMSCATFTISAARYVTGSNPVSASYKAGKYYAQLSQIPATSNARTNVIAVAMSQIGYTESDTDGDFAGTSGGSGNFTEYNYNFGNWGVGYGGADYPWCACFATWVFRQAGINTMGTGISNAARNNTTNSSCIWCEISCNEWYAQLERFGYAQASAARGGSYVPKSADIIFFSNSGTKSTHVGFVVYTDGAKVYTVEGNTSSADGLDGNGGGVYYKSYALDSTYIYGYGAMPYNTDASNIDYSGANPTPGVYVAATSNKYLYKDVANVGSNTYDLLMPQFSMFAVTEVVSQSVLKCTYNGGTYYISNNNDRIVQITQTTGSVASTTTPGINASMFIDTINELTPGVEVAGSTIGGHSHPLMPIAQPTSTTMTISGWAIVSGGQPANSMHYSFDYGASWEQCAGGVYYSFSNEEISRVNEISATHAISNLSITNARFMGAQVNLAGKEGQTVNVTLGVKGADGGIYPCITIIGVEVPGGSSSGGGGSVATSDKAMAAVINNINGVGPDGTANTNYSTELISTHANVATATLPKSLTEPFIYITGWCMTNNGQTNEIKFSVDGGTTWVATCSVTSWLDGTDDHVAAASAMAGMPNPVVTNATFLSACANLSAYAGMTGNVTFGRTSSWGETIPFLTINNVSVPGESQSDTTDPFPEPTAIYTGTPAYGLRYVANVDYINELGNDGVAANPTNSWGALGWCDIDNKSGLDRVTPAIVNNPSIIKTQSDNSIYIKGWAAVAAGVYNYVYAVDDTVDENTKWYLCSGTLSTATGDDNTNISAFATADPYKVNGYSPTNVRFQNLKADLTHWQGQTVSVHFGAISAAEAYTTSKQPCHFITIENVSVPAHVCQSVNEATCTDPKICDTCGATMAYALGHKPGDAATCTTDQTCKNCGIVLVAHTGHKAGNAATCTTDQVCTTCGTVLNAKTGHTAGAAATCTTNQICTTCGEILAQATGHTPGASATCTTNQTCIRCDYIFATATGHTPGPEATCTADQKCTTCQTILTPKTGHTPAGDATCTEDSLCTVCGALISAAKDHILVTLPGKAPTCTEAGLGEGQKCSVCGVITIPQEILPSLGHTGGPAATCTTSQTCTVCKAVIQEAYGHSPGPEATCKAPQICTRCTTVLVAQKAHTPGDEATCTTDQICTVCNTVLVEQFGHTEKVTKGTPATCTQNGVTDMIECTVCHKIIQAQETIIATGHKWLDATCTAPQTCENCGLTEGDALGHQRKEIAAKNPTCTEEGNSAGERCDVCGEIFVEPEIYPALGHTGGAEATCTTNQYCMVCGDIVVAAYGHDENDIPAVAPTCTTTGLSAGRVCNRCKITIIPRIEIPALGHTYDDENDTVCNVCGYERNVGCQHEYYNACDADCNICGETRVPAEHVVQVLESRPATCTSSGLTEGQICSACNKIIVAQATIRPLYHSYRVSETVTATCTTRGYTLYTCQNDGCTNSYQSDFVASTGHDYATQNISATCVSGSYKKHTCRREGCNDSYITDYVSAGGHKYTDTVIPPTCTSRGYTVHVCTCGMSYRDTYVSAKGHNYNTSTVAATCTSRGYTLLSCTGCSLEYKTNYSTGTVSHNYSSSVVPATCTERGYTLHECTKCDAYYKTDFTQAAGHSYTSVVTAPTKDSIGYTTHTCSKCKDVYYSDITDPTP
ncbi:MAG: CHAP domain-containing protein [Clostridia bacterium]|nr:CHAP domain-containing protein [Clostridia bacterium]